MTAAQDAFDVFISHNRKELEAVLDLTGQLKARGVRVWLDRDQLRPGERWQTGVERAIETCGTAAILVGKDGLGPWEIPEMHACLEECVRRRLPVIPVLLPGAQEHPDLPDLPLFLRGLTWVDLREGFTKVGLDRLIWGITGRRILETARELVVSRAQANERQGSASQYVDSWGIASVKSRIHGLSEVVAQAAADSAEYAAATYADDVLSIGVRLAFEMRWRRGYAAALEKLLRIPKSEKHVRDFSCEAIPDCEVTEGLVSAVADGDSGVIVSLNGQPAVNISGVSPPDREMLVDSINLHGRLGVQGSGNSGVLDRIGGIAVRPGVSTEDELAAALFQNREALAPLIARLGIPGSEWLLTHEEQFSSTTNEVRPDSGDIEYHIRWSDWRVPESAASGVEELFDARKAALSTYHGAAGKQMRDLLNSDAARTLFGDLVDTDPQRVMEMIAQLGRPRA